MGVGKELFELGFKKISKATMNFLETGVPRTDHAGIIRAATNSPQELTEYIRHADNFVKKKDQSGILPMIQYSDKWNNEVVEATKQADTLSLGTTPAAKQDALYTRPDAIESLRKLGGQTKWGKTQRTIQGPVSPNLSDKTFAQGATTPEEAIMAPSGGTTKFVKDGDPFQIRNYGAAYAPKGQTTKVGTRKTTGRGKTAEGDTRKINEALATDPNITDKERKAFAKIMAEAAAKGMDGDHIIEVSRVANAVRDMSPERRAAYFEVMRRTGTPTGNHPKNIQILSKEMNQVVKPAEIRALDNALRNMDKRGKSLLEDLLGI